MTNPSTDLRSRTFYWDDPLQGAMQALSMSGIEYLKAMQEGKIPLPPIMHTLGFTGLNLEYGRVTFTFVPQEYHYNPIGTVHGGVISTILDSAMGCTIHSTLPAGVGYTTLELKVNFLKAITLKTGEMYCTGKIIHNGSKTALVEASLTDKENKVYAHGVSTCLILKAS
jgi:uncharacterized protein (TIGR00369 family)